MKEQIRCKCPLCGMMFNESHLNSTPYKIKVFIQQFGGKVAGNIKGRGKAKGFIKYTDVTKSHPEIIRKIREKIELMNSN